MLDTFARRHIGPSPEDQKTMLASLGFDSLDALSDAAVPEVIRTQHALDVARGKGESEMLAELKTLAGKNKVLRSFIGQGYYDTITPPVIQRNILENPGWYTQYTPYQPEISQGRLEALLNFQTMVVDLTGLPISNGSLLDEGTAAAEAMTMCRAQTQGQRKTFLVASTAFPQTIALLKTRAEPVGIDLVVADPKKMQFNDDVFGVLLQTPASDGQVIDYTDLIARAQAAGALVVVATDLLALTLTKTPGEMNADVAIGNAQRFGVPLGFGGPHAAFMACSETFKRSIPGRIVGVSKDVHGRPALRLAMQTREQHIRREKATSNICTAQVLLANMAGMYAVYHGPQGLTAIAERVHLAARTLAKGLAILNFKVQHDAFFDTLRVELAGEPADDVIARARSRGFNIAKASPVAVTISCDETTSRSDIAMLLTVFCEGCSMDVDDLSTRSVEPLSRALRRTTPFLTHPTFNSYHSETELLRYMHRLEAKDIALNTSMIPLGSCTMKLNGTSEMMPLSWPEFSRIHPFAPADQTRGYVEMFNQLEKMIANITGFYAVSLQPNAGSQGEYAGLLVIRQFHRDRGQGHRKVCLIPESAHGTNPASAIMCGMQVVVVKNDPRGNIDLPDLRAKAAAHSDDLAALMVTYPSTYGVFEEGIREICNVVHAAGGQVYMDGANLNAQVGLARPGEIGADVCHLNLHKTFAIPHGGGGPGMGPIAVAEHLAPYLPGHPTVRVGGEKAIGPVSAAPWGSASILTISYIYMTLMGNTGLRQATQVAILNANYMAKRLEGGYDILFRGGKGQVAHEFILDLRPFDQSAGIKAEDVAKRLMDFGYHAPTMSWPVAGTIMVEPTESESKAELDRFCDAMLTIRDEIRAVECGKLTREDNPLKHAPHTAEHVTATEWNHAYRREQAAYPAKWVKAAKYWPPVARVDNAFGDRNFVCSCPPISAYA
ncbi:MAG: aminomethyl-transferring glycine dehydrogenase [Clostridia bacterium]|nr:aminomethyl-transferring glycine dehydrogenase [Deltaproteobacteria bacterium]